MKQKRIPKIKAILVLLSISFFSEIFANCWEDIHRKFRLGVVQIHTYIKEFNWEKPYSEGDEYRVTGSGFFINIEDNKSDNHPYIVSNYHVVKGAKVIEVQIPELGEQKFLVKVCIADPDKDIAFLKFKSRELEKFKSCLNLASLSKNIQCLELENSDKLKESQKIMALGFPLGHKNRKTNQGRKTGSGSYSGMNVFHLDVPINPGNSGGPIINKEGKVVGIIFSRAEGEAQNIGFAIPINEISGCINAIKNKNYEKKLLESPFWGVSIQPTLPETTIFLKMNHILSGVRIFNIVKNSLFEDFGFKTGDIIFAIELNNQYSIVDSFGDINVSWNEAKISFYDFLTHLKSEESAKVFVCRKNNSGEIKNIEIEVKSQPKCSTIKRVYPELEKNEILYANLGGATIMELTLNHIELIEKKIENFLKEYSMLPYFSAIKYALPENRSKQRLIITHIEGGSQIENTRCFKPWDIIKKINGQRVKRLSDLVKALKISKTTGYCEIENEEGIYASIAIA